LDGIDQVLSRPAVLKTAEILGGNDNHVAAALDDDMLGTFTSRTMHKLTEMRLRVLQPPTAWQCSRLQFRYVHTVPNKFKPTRLEQQEVAPTSSIQASNPTAPDP
jgi:hypothetical protein